MPLANSLHEALKVHPAHEADRIRMVSGQFSGGHEERFENPIERRRLVAVFGFQAIHHGQAVRVYRAHPARDYVVQQLFLVPEVVVNRSQVDLGLGDNVAQGRGPVALVREQAFGGIEDSVFRINHSNASIE
jgi:hypothetical protein